MYETLLFLHVLSAFLLVAAIGLCWAIYSGGGSLVRLGAVVFPVWGAASIAVLVFGVWLAFDVSGYQAAGTAGSSPRSRSVARLRAPSAASSRRATRAMADGAAERSGRALSAHVVATAAVAPAAHRHGLEAGRMTFLLIRPDSWNLPLFVHVAGAMLVTASVVVAVAALLLAWRATGEERAAVTRFGFRTLLIAGIPSYLLMLLAAEWIRSRESLSGDNQPGWVGAGGR